MTDHTLPQDKQLPPGNTGLPLIGNSLQYFQNPLFLEERYQKYGPIFKTHIFGRPTAVMVGPEASDFVLSKGMHHFSWKEGWPSTFQELLGESLFVQDGEEHRQKRKLLMPAFHREALHRYLDTMEALTLQYLQEWEEKQTFTWFEENKKLTFDIANTLLLGGEPQDDSEELSQLFTILTRGMFTLGISWSWTPYGQALQAREKLLAHIEKAIERRKQNPTNDALTLLLATEDEDGNSLSVDELKAQALLLLFAGHETTTSLVTSLCLALWQNPDVWEATRAEQDALDIEDSLTMEHIRQMPYLEQVLKEVERLYPPVFAGFRGVVKPFEFNGYYVPEGWQLIYAIPLTHRSDNVWDNPHTFDPDRFSPENKANQPRFSLLGFGGGPRVCIGYSFAQLEMKVIASHLLRKYTWEPLPDQNLDIRRIPTLHPKDGFKVRFQRR